MDRLQSLKVFVAVAEAESFAAGARAAGLSAPSATRSVKALETALGARLLTRTTRQVRLTEVGRAYLRDVREILANLQVADESASGTAGSPAGHLRITCPQEFGRIYMAPLVANFLDRHAGMRAEVLMVDRIVNIVEEGFDIALRIGPLPSSGLIALRVGQVRRVVCGAPEYFETRGRPKTLAELKHHRLLSVAPINSGRRWQFLEGNGGTAGLNSRLSTSSVAAAIDLARRGWCLCQVLSYQIGPDIEAGMLETVLESHEVAPLPVHLVHAEGRRAPAKIRAFLDFAAERLRDVAALK